MNTQTNENKRKYKVIIKDSENKIQEMHSFELLENAIGCFLEFQRRYSYYHKIIIEAIKL